MPDVTWWQEERMIDRHVEVRQYSENGVASNVLQFERLGRSDLRTRLSCHASNSLLAQPPLTKFVEIELNREYRNTFYIVRNAAIKANNRQRIGQRVFFFFFGLNKTTDTYRVRGSLCFITRVQSFQVAQIMSGFFSNDVSSLCKHDFVACPSIARGGGASRGNYFVLELFALVIFLSCL